MKKIHAATLATIFLLSTVAIAQQNAPAAESKSSAPPPGTVTGSGTTNYIPMWTGSTTLGNSFLYQNGGIGINTTSPHYSLDVNGHVNGAGYLIGGSLVLTLPAGSYGGNNLALGPSALTGNTTGYDNTADGWYALGNTTTGVMNTAIGAYAGDSNTTGSRNTATGTYALSSGSELSMSDNTASGYAALINNSSGSGNTAIGSAALASNTSGSFNIAIGYDAAANAPGGNSYNIHIGSEGASTDSGTIRLGMNGFQTSFFAAGIYGVSSGSSSAIPVLVDSSGQLVTVSSSRRFKEDIHDMGDASHDLMRLRPVTFRYRKPLADGSQPIQYGLIAEEVAEVFPDLVAHSADGQIQTVKYQLLDPMLLNEAQRQQAEIQRQQAQIRELQERLNKIEFTLSQAVTTQPK